MYSKALSLFLQYNSFLNTTRLKKCVLKLLILVLLYLILFLIDIRLRKCVTRFSKDPFMLQYCLDKYKTQKCVIKLLIIFCQH